MLIFMSHRVPKTLISIFMVLLILLAAVAMPMQAKAVAVVDDAVIWSIVALLSGWGISFTASDASKAEVTQTVRDLLEDAGIEIAAASAVSMQLPGIIKIAPAIYNAALLLGQYLINQVGSDSGSHTVVSGGYTFFVFSGSVKYYDTLPAGVTLLPFESTELNLSNRVLSISLSSSGYVLTLDGRNFGSGANQVIFSAPEDSRYLGFSTTDASSDYVTLCFVCYLNGSWVVQPVGNWINKNLFLASSSGFAFDAVLDQAAVPDEITDIPVYVTGPGLVYGNTTAMEETWYDHVTDQEKSYPVTQVYPTAYEAQAAQAGSKPVEDINPDLDPVVGLVDVFPFCIPFDIYNFLSIFNHTREAPSFNFPLALPEYIGGTQEIEFDLSAFDTVAQVLRTVELIAFIVGLAYETRKFIKW